MPNSRHSPAILSPSNSRAMNLSRSSIGLHSFQGIFALPQKAQLCNPCLRNELSPLSQEGHDVLSAVRLSGSVFFDVTAKSPWVAEAPPGAQIANEVTPGAQHAIEYHVVTRGSCWISLIGDAGFEPVRLEEGDVAVIPRGDPHVVSSAPGMRAVPNLDMHRRPEDSNALPFVLRTGGEGASDTHVICGFFSCDARPFNPLLD